MGRAILSSNFIEANMDKRVLIALTQNNPDIQKGIDTIKAQLADKRIDPRQLTE